MNDWKVGDSLIIKNRHGILGGHNFTNGETYEVVEIGHRCTPIIIKDGRRFKVHDFEIGSVERVAKENPNGLNS